MQKIILYSRPLQININNQKFIRIFTLILHQLVFRTRDGDPTRRSFSLADTLFCSSFSISFVYTSKPAVCDESLSEKLLLQTYSSSTWVISLALNLRQPCWNAKGHVTIHGLPTEKAIPIQNEVLRQCLGVKYWNFHYFARGAKSVIPPMITRSIINRIGRTYDVVSPVE
jgi:hypothetical protein